MAIRGHRSGDWSSHTWERGDLRDFDLAEGHDHHLAVLVLMVVVLLEEDSADQEEEGYLVGE